MSRWCRLQDPFVDVDAKMVHALVGHVASPAASRAVLLQTLRSMTQVLQTRAVPELAHTLFRLALDRTTDARGCVRAGALRALCDVAQPQWCEDAQVNQKCAANSVLFLFFGSFMLCCCSYWLDWRSSHCAMAMQVRAPQPWRG